MIILQLSRLLDDSTLEKYDSQQMCKVYDRWPEIALESFESNQNCFNFNGVNHIIFAGMGGSGALGDMFASILSKTNVHVNVVKGYILPKTVDSNSLVITTSVSGNTVETLSVLKLAKNTDCKIIAFSSDGKMLQYCKENNLKHIKIPKYHSPRASFVVFLYTMLNVLKLIIPIKENEVYESIKKLKILQSKISSSNLTKKNPSLELAKWITGIPLIYNPWGLNAAAIRFKNSLNENAKLHAMVEDVIETCHNGIVSWEKSSNIQPILLRGRDDNEQTKDRLEILKEYFTIHNIESKEILSEEGSILSKLICLIYLLDYTSIYKAILSKIDPTPINSIDFVKSRL
jgi:glucose/mannose-6-phosphate isomerase